MAKKLRILAYTCLGLTALCFLAICTLDRWMFVALDPGPFDPSNTPPAPNYTEPAAWAALPELDDGADVALAELPASAQSQAHVAVFFVHPTTWIGGQWNAPFDDPAVVEATHRGATLIQASVFNACCAVYAPRYRQANGNAFTRPSEHGDKAVDVAFHDVDAAFSEFLSRIGERPFVLAAHSQGSALSARLLRERISPNSELRKNLVAAYLIGGPLWPESIGDVPVCTSATQTGCVVAYNARAPGYQPNNFEFRSATHNHPIAGRICVNPLTWRADETPGTTSQHLGAVFFDTPKTPRVLPNFSDATCMDGALILSTTGPLERDFMSSLLLWLMPGNYHPIEYQLFYVNLRKNAEERVQAYQNANTPATKPLTLR